LKVNEAGDLLVETAWGIFTEQRPLIYQEKRGRRVPLRGQYDLITKDAFRFKVRDDYDKGLPLIIDPLLKYSTYLGGSHNESGEDIAIDASGGVYIAGYTRSADLPLAGKPYQGTLDGYKDAFISKLKGGNLIYCTYLGGSNLDSASGIDVDSDGNAYIIGNTRSTDFPTVNAFQPTLTGDGDPFVTKLNDQGDGLVFSTYLGGEDHESGSAIVVGADNHAYITGGTGSEYFPVEEPYQSKLAGGTDAFIAKLAGGSLVYSTYFGGSSYDSGNDIALDALGGVYILGTTTSDDLPVENPYQGTHAERYDLFITKLNMRDNTLIYSTYLGGSDYDLGAAIAVDSLGHACVTGITGWRPDRSDHSGCTGSTEWDPFPTKNAYQGDPAGEEDAVVAKFNRWGDDLIFSTFLGGYSYDEGLDIAVDAIGQVYITGITVSFDFPIQDSMQDLKWGDAFIALMGVQGQDLIYSTFFGGSYWEHGYGITVDSNGNAYITGVTNSSDFPTKNAWQKNPGGYEDAFVAKISPLPPKVPVWLETETDFEDQPAIKGGKEQTFQKRE